MYCLSQKPKQRVFDVDEFWIQVKVPINHFNKDSWNNRFTATIRIMKISGFNANFIAYKIVSFRVGIFFVLISVLGSVLGSQIGDPIDWPCIWKNKFLVYCMIQIHTDTPHAKFQAKHKLGIAADWREVTRPPYFYFKNNAFA